MAKADIYNQAGEKKGSLELEPKLFGVEINPELVQQAVRTHMANARTTVAHTKDRSEVRGGGRKPWRQKGTGRARHGSIRSPLWSGGGVTFGPRQDRNYTLKMNKKARRKALCMALTDKAQRNKIVILEDLQFKSIKTKQLAGLLQALSIGTKVLIITPGADAILAKSARNMPQVSILPANSLNTVAVLRPEVLLAPKPSLDVMIKTYTA